MGQKFLSIIKKIINNFLSNPVYFVIRQLYRLVFVLPFQVIVAVLYFFIPRQKINVRQPESFCFLVTSVIYPVLDKKVTYGTVRSVFGPEDRAKQTVSTVESIRSKVSGSKVVLIEGGLREELPVGLASQVDQYIYLGNKRLVRWACDSRFKSLGEAVMLLYALKYLKQTADFYFKISGRYFLDNDFDVRNWKEGQFILYFLQTDYISTRLYGFRKEMMREWKMALVKGLPFALIGYPIENTLAKFIPRRYVRKIEKMGVRGISAGNDIMKE